MRRGPIKPLPSQEELQKLFDYDPLTGVIKWKHRPDLASNIDVRLAGTPAGTVNGKSGYLVVGIKKPGAKVSTYYLAHRLIWKLVTGEDPIAMIDHEDTNKLNNQWRNFRPATNGQNIANSKLRKDNKTGIKGVTWDGPHKAYAVHVSVNGRQHKIGRFKTIEAAEIAVTRARSEMHGEFARAS